MKQIVLLLFCFILLGCSQAEEVVVEKKVTDMNQPEAKELVVAAMTILQLQQAGIPIECYAKVTVSGQKYNSKVSLLKANIKTEATTAEGPVVSVFKDDKSYVQLDQQLLTQRTKGFIKTDCGWLVMEPQTASQPPQVKDAVPQTDPREVTKLPPGEYKCAKASFGQERFATPGKVCMMSELLSAAIPQLSGITIPGLG